MTSEIMKSSESFTAFEQHNVMS